MALRIIMLGDIVGGVGRRAVAQLLPALRAKYRPHIVLANAENAAAGSGLTPELYRKIAASGVDAMTLGDHVYKKAEIVATLETVDNLIRPANLPAGAKGRRWMQVNAKADAEAQASAGRSNSPPSQGGAGGGLDARTPGVSVSVGAPSTTGRPTLPQPLPKREGSQSNAAETPSTANCGARDLPPIFVMTVLGRIFMHHLPGDDPFRTVDQVMAELPRKDPIVIVEVHAEATSEKQAMGWYLDGRVSAVLGTHTHVATADARVLPKGTAYITDLGMCGPMTSVLGRSVQPVLLHMTTGMHAPYDVAEDDPRINGIYIEIDENTRRAIAVERIEMKADVKAPPFVM